MENNELKQFVESVAEIKTITPKREGSVIGEPEIVIRNGKVIELGDDENPTLGFKLIKLKDQIKACELGCGQTVKNQIIEKRMAFHPEAHWRTYCKQCKGYLHPDGVTIVKGGHRIQSIFLDYFKKKNK